MPSWPEFMPDPVFRQIQIGAPVGSVLRSNMDTGPAKQRRRFTAAPRPVALLFSPITAFDLARFEAFFEVELAYGALAFDMAHPVTDAQARFRFVADNNEAYGSQPIGRDAYQLSVRLELLP